METLKAKENEKKIKRLDRVNRLLKTLQKEKNEIEKELEINSTFKVGDYVQYSGRDSVIGYGVINSLDIKKECANITFFTDSAEIETSNIYFNGLKIINLKKKTMLTFFEIFKKINACIKLKESEIEDLDRKSHELYKIFEKLKSCSIDQQDEYIRTTVKTTFDIYTKVELSRDDLK